MRVLRWLRGAGIALLALAVIIIALYFVFRIKTVKVEGNNIYSEQDIRDAVFVRRYSDNELMLRVYSALFGLGELPFVEDIDIEYENRNTVVLHVYEKAISGCIKYMGQYVYFDRDGTVLQSMEEHWEGVPVVTGIKFGNFVIGAKFEVEDDRLFSAIMNVSQLIGHYGISVRRIHVKDRSVTLYSGKVKVFLGEREHYDDQIAVLPDVIKQTKKEKLSGYIDMTSYKEGDVVVFKRDKTSKKQDKNKVSEK